MYNVLLFAFSILGTWLGLGLIGCLLAKLATKQKENLQEWFIAMCFGPLILFGVLCMLIKKLWDKMANIWI